MRTDSTNVASVAQQEAREVIAARYGKEYLPDAPPVYARKSQHAQEAHEAIRPTLAARDLDSIKRYLSSDQQRLYRLIWQRFIASQMANAILDQTTVDVGAGKPSDPTPKPYTFRAMGSVIKFRGYISVYREDHDAGDAEDDLDKSALPILDEGELLDLLELLPEQHFTQPPPRYTEATLVKMLEEKGIGRPSTYAPILSTIQDRQYVERVDKRFQPAELGLIVNDLLVEHFPNIVDVEFTAGLEEQLDDVARGEQAWVPVVRTFYDPFEQRLERVSAEIPRVKVPAEITEERCEKCGSFMAIKLG